MFERILKGQTFNSNIFHVQTLHVKMLCAKWGFDRISITALWWLTGGSHVELYQCCSHIQNVLLSVKQRFRSLMQLV